MVGKLRRQGVFVLLGLFAVLALPQLASAAGSSLEQCANGKDSGTEPCLLAAWQNGNLNPENSLYREGDFVPFRAQLTDLPAGQPVTIVIAYDAVEHDNHAYDYLGSWNGSETGDPCSGATCPAGTDTHPIPVDPSTDFPNPASSQVPGVFTLYGGDITNVQYVPSPPTPVVDVNSTGTIERRIAVTFVPTGDTVLLAWGGHIASQIDWGAGETAVSDISGSPYHMRLIEFIIGGEVESIGNQDRSLKGAAVAPVPPNFETEASAASITLGSTITDSAFLSGNNGPVTGTVNFFVCADTTVPFDNPDCSGLNAGSAAGSGTLSSGVATSPAFTPATIGRYCFRAEYAPDAFAPYSPGTHTNMITASVPFGQAPFGECFEVVQPVGTVEVVKVFVGTTTSVGLQVDGTTRTTVTANGTTGPITVPAGPHTAGEVFTGGNASNYTTSFACTRNGTSFLSGSALTTPSFTVNNGDAVVCIYTNTRKQGSIRLVKDFVGAPADAMVHLKIAQGATTIVEGDRGDGGFVEDTTVDTGSYDLSESGVAPTDLANYTTILACTGGTLTGSSVAVTEGATVVCTFTNTRKAASILVTKTANPTSLPEPGGPVQFTVVVKNTSVSDDVTLTAAGFVDAVEGGPATAISDIDCNGAAAGNGLPTTLAPNAEVTCTFTKTVSGNADDVIDDVVTVTGTGEDGQSVSDDDDASVTLTDVLPDITVVKTANPTSLPEPGGNVTYTVVVTNGSVVEALTLTSLVDDKFGNLDGKGSCDVPQTIAAGGSYTCTFTGAVTGNAGFVHVNVVTATGQDDDGNTDTDTDDATVTITDVPSSLVVEKTASPTSVQAPGGNVTFTVVVKNTSATDSVTLTAAGFTDKVGSGPTEAISNIDCNGATAGSGLPLVLAPNNGAAGGPDEVTCTFVKAVNGSGGTSVTDVVTVTGTDDDGNTVKDDDDATVTITSPPTPPTPPAPAPLIDLAVTKTDAPDPAALNSNITYTMIVTNNGPSTATNVRLADPLPAGTTFVSVTTNQGTCTGGAAISCNLGTILVGQRVEITLVVTATVAGTVTNTVTVVGNEPESNTANNSATATTLVPAPLTPPTPQPKPTPVICYTFTVSSKALTVGKTKTLTVAVKARGKAVKGARVVVRGAGVLKTARTNAQGKATILITPRRAGIITVTVPQKIVCGSRRIGVVGAFEPPVTG